MVCCNFVQSDKSKREYVPNKYITDRSVGARDDLYGSEASLASVFCFDNASPEKSCFFDDLVCFISLCVRVYVLLNATRRVGNCSAFEIRRSKGSEFTISLGTEVCSLEDLSKSVKWRAYVVSDDVTTRLHGQNLLQGNDSFSWMTSPALIDEVVYVCQHFINTKSYQANITAEIAKQMNFS